MKRLRLLLFLSVGIICVLYAFFSGRLNHFSTENYIAILAGIFSISYGLFWPMVRPYTFHGVGKLVKYIFYGGVIFTVVTFIILFFMVQNAAKKTPINDLDAMVVLGCGLRGYDISLTLKARLDKALEYAYGNPDAVIVVSGGQGSGELTTEAFAMKKYLAANGIDENRILVEENSTSTKENMLFSKIVLDNYFNGAPYKIVFVSNDFHILRAGYYAKMAGLNAESLACDSLYYLTPSFYLREYLALMKYFIFEGGKA